MAKKAVVHVLGDTPLTPSVRKLVANAARAALCHEGVAGDAEVTIALVTAAESRRLNRTYRGVDAETDVLSFGAQSDEPAGQPASIPRYLGDIAINRVQAERQAADFGHSLAREVAFLTVHGVLHLLGHDHHAPEERRRMRTAEETILAQLALVR